MREFAVSFTTNRNLTVTGRTAHVTVNVSAETPGLAIAEAREVLHGVVLNPDQWVFPMATETTDGDAHAAGYEASFYDNEVHALR